MIPLSMGRPFERSPETASLGLNRGGRYCERKLNFVGQHFWARGYFVSTLGRDGAQVRNYIRNQEKEDGKPGKIFRFSVRMAHDLQRHPA